MGRRKTVAAKTTSATLESSLLLIYFFGPATFCPLASLKEGQRLLFLTPLRKVAFDKDGRSQASPKSLTAFSQKVFGKRYFINFSMTTEYCDKFFLFCQELFEG